MRLIKPSLLVLPLSTAISLSVLVGCDTLSPKKSSEQTQSIPASDNNISARQSVAPGIAAPSQRSYDNIWDRIRAGYGLPATSNTAIDAQIRFYTSNKKYFSKVTEQSEPYLHYVVTQMQAANIPLELALLPFVESAYNPSAVSPGNAGMWQLAAATGKNFGLKQNSWYDGRKDVVASTDAAIRLLNKLHTMFDGDWLLAVAAYNAGEGTIQQAVEKNRRAGKPTDFWSLPLNQTTTGYIPQLLALSKIIANPERYDFQLAAIPDTPYFVKINVDSQINFADAARNTDIDVTQLKKLNAGYSGWLTDPTGPHQLLVPVADAASFTLKLDSLPKIPNQKWQEHVVKKGDNLDAIAKKYGVASATIRSTNNLKANGLSVGQRLQIPLTPLPANQYDNEKVVADNQVSKDSTQNNYYTVKSGENLWSIARAQKTSVNNLAQLNDMDPQASLKPGQKLIVLSQANDEEIKEPRKLTYTVKAGDTLGKIAAQYKVSAKQIMQWNKIKDETSLRPNQELTLLVGPN